LAQFFVALAFVALRRAPAAGFDTRAARALSAGAAAKQGGQLHEALHFAEAEECALIAARSEILRFPRALAGNLRITLLLARGADGSRRWGPGQ